MADSFRLRNRQLLVAAKRLLINCSVCFSQFFPLSNKTLYEIKSEKELYFDSLKTAIGDSAFYHEGSEFNQFMQWLAEWEPRLFPNGRFDLFSQAEYQGIQQTSLQYSNFRGVGGASSNNQTPWIEIGPVKKPENGMGVIGGGDRGIGPIEFINIYKLNSNYMLCGSESGGLFYSDNGGASWANSGSDLQWDNSDCGWAEFHPTNPDIWYASNSKIPLNDTRGIYRTFDHGQTWNKIYGYHVTGFGYWQIILKTVLDHTSPDDILYVATSDGIYKTTTLANSSPTFIKLSDPLVNGVVADLEMKVNDHNHLIACVRDNLILSHWHVVQSLDGGITWNMISGYPTLLDNMPISNDPYYAAVSTTVELTASNPDYFYFFINNLSSSAQIYRYNYVNGVWTNLSPTSLYSPYGSGHAFGVSQMISDDIFVSDNITYQKYISGQWSGSSGNYHVDLEDFVADPSDPNVFWMANHGGVNKSSDKGVTWTNMSDGLGVAMVIGFAWSKTNPEYNIMGLYHDGTVRTDPPYILNSTPQWRTVNGGDGLICQIDYTNPQYMWASSQYSSALSSSFGIEYSFNASFEPTINQKDWGIVVKEDLFNPNIIYSSHTVSGRTDVARSADRGNTFTIISDFNLYFGITSYLVYDVFTSPANPNYLYAHIVDFDANPDNHRVFRTKFVNAANPKPTWEELYVPQNGWIGDIKTDFENPNIIYINWSSSSVNFPIGSGVIYKIDYSNSNTQPAINDLTKNLPYVTADGAIVLEEASDGGIYLPTNLGVFYANNKLLNNSNTNIGWTLLGSGLPHSKIKGVIINYKANRLRVGLEGRGAWENNLYCPDDYDLPLTGSHNSYFFEAQHNISSTASIANNVKVKYRGGYAVEMNPGFIADVGSTFEAFIHPCDHEGNSFRQTSTELLQEITSIKEISPIEKILLYPNPTTGNIVLLRGNNIGEEEDNENLENINVSFYDIMGRNVYTNIFSGRRLNIDLSHCNKGMYLVQLKDESGEMVTKKIILQ